MFFAYTNTLKQTHRARYKKVLLSRQMNAIENKEKHVFHVYIDKMIYILSIFLPAFTAVHSIFHRKYVSNMHILFKYSLLKKSKKKIFALKARNKFGLIQKRQLVILSLLKLAHLKVIRQKTDITHCRPEFMKRHASPKSSMYFSGSLFPACRDGGSSAHP